MQPFGEDASHGFVRRFHVIADAARRNACFLGFENERIDIALCGRKFAIDGECARNIAGIVIDFGACIDEDEIACLQGVAIGVVVKRRGMCTAGANRPEAFAHGAIDSECVLERRFDFPFADAGFEHGEDVFESFGADVSGAFEDFDFVVVFDASHFSDDIADIGETPRTFG